MTVTWDDIGGLVDAHERFLAGAHVDADVRGPVLDSWKRCRSGGLEPHQLVLPYTPDLTLEERFLRAADPVLQDLTVSLADVGMTVALCDPQGRMVQRLGGGRRLRERLDEVSFAPGFDASEPVAGTNGVGTALAERGAVYVAGREHFADCLAPFACAGAPVRDPLSGRIEAVLDLTCLRGDGDPAMLRLVREAARDIEARMLEQATQRERALLAAYRRAGGDPGGWPRQPQGRGLDDGGPDLGRIDLAVLREKAEELIASPHLTLDEVALPGGRTATLLRRQITGPDGETGVAVEARIIGGPRLRHVRDGRTSGTGGLVSSAGSTGPLPLVAPTGTGPPPAASPTTAAPTAPARPAPATAAAVPALVPAPPGSAPRPIPHVTADSDGEGRLLLVGEPGVGRLAVLARRRLEFLHDAGVRIGTTLDVTRTAEELAEVTVPRFADFAAVDLPDLVLRGEEPGPLGAATPLRRVALGALHEESQLYGVGEVVEYVPSTPQARSLETRQSVLEPVLAEARGWIAQDPPRLERVLDVGIHSLITVPLRARGTTLGVVSFYRSEKPTPFEDDDLYLAQELVGRAAICIDNARRFTREHDTALALQRSLLPRGRPEQSAVEVAYRYLPAQAGVGGDWFDVIPLSGARVALVVGDVVGHGLHAAATMGRLRTAVHNFCSLDLPPDDLLTHLDDLVGRLDRGEGWAVEKNTPDSGIVGATCLYAVYDPVSRRCTLTRAGHPVPAVVGPDGAVDFVDLPSGPPLGLGGMPFETAELELAEGSQLVLYTDGLVEDRMRDIDSGLDLLRSVLARADRAPEETCEAVLDALLPARPSDDVALLVARTHALGPDQVAQWDLPSDPAVVSRSRAAVTEQLAAWGLDDLAFTTELVASELVTNAIRHATGPVQLRLLRDRALICEVSDGSSTSPRLRRARTEDEGGRGLFLVAQLTERWGTRYAPDGKIIWTEQPLP
ncbi:SpoIIE family protein phosphatase [Streptomyces lomondensis]|uniref:SpoIIE family protein phosphatase n=1 Tax=Streptomyces lomondensis TaxID=68229 RepID=UPI001E5B0DB6|nr:SpoIIE family protein phosphatase [Streptomyces lomondensis]MCF0077192.1 SpoIIE family protein phosphatase [Streptomyces lomondensis]